MLRAAFQAMEQVAANILEHDRSQESDDLCVDLPKLFDLVGVGK
jgi:hypothetical protein